LLSLATWPLVVYSGLAFAIVLGMIAVSFVLGERHKDNATQTAYESGILPTGAGKLRYSVKFYLVAMFFVVFDVESVFFFAWAVAFRELGWSGFIEITIFTGVLLAALVYLLRLGALDWGAAGKNNEESREKE
jgi:NADH-quinone oxidoreductase subunit A